MTFYTCGYMDGTAGGRVHSTRTVTAAADIHTTPIYIVLSGRT